VGVGEVDAAGLIEAFELAGVVLMCLCARGGRNRQSNEQESATNGMHGSLRLNLLAAPSFGGDTPLKRCFTKT
jgi:hypothetical protein